MFLFKFLKKKPSKKLANKSVKPRATTKKMSIPPSQQVDDPNRFFVPLYNSFVQLHDDYKTLNAKYDKLCDIYAKQAEYLEIIQGIIVKDK